jgi:hypothetical protein
MKKATDLSTPVAGLPLLRVPFPAHQVQKLPKGGVLLDYVGHAALTDRLLDADPEWNWEPLAVEDGLPKLDEAGGLWIRLTVCGLTRLGYGHAGGKTGGDAVKELIGDALRNAAMRFGAALDLWHKGDLHQAETPEAVPPPPAPAGYETFRSDLENMAKNGLPALQKHWRGNKNDTTMQAHLKPLRDYCFETERAWWEELKKVAATNGTKKPATASNQGRAE